MQARPFPLPSVAPAEMHAQLKTAYEKLRPLRLEEHARDFWRMRASKQPAQLAGPGAALLHEHTALAQYLAWHGPDGRRLPGFARGGAVSLAQI